MTYQAEEERREPSPEDRERQQEHAQDGRDGHEGRDGRRGERGPRGKDGKRGKRGRRRHSFLRFLLVCALLFWLLHAYYNDDVPGVPFIDCSTPSATQAGLPVPPLPGMPPGVPLPDDMLPDTGLGGWLLKTSAKGMLVGAGHMAGKTLHNLVSSPPSVDSIVGTWDGIIGTAGDFGGAFVTGVKGGAAPKEDEEDGFRPGLPMPMFPSLPVNGSGPELAARAALAAGWTGEDAVTAVAIAGAESGYNPRAENPSSSAKGLWQTMMSLHEPKYAGSSWSDPAANARVAHQIWEEAGRSWTPWTVYSSGAYRSHLGEARQAIEQLNGSGGGVVSTAAVAGPDPRVGDSGSTPTKPHVLAAASLIRSQFGFDGTIGGSADSGHVAGSAHYEGLALDVMVTGETADRIADYFAEGPGFEAFGVVNVIWDREIYNRPQGWHAYPDRGNPTLNHEDHVHIDFTPQGGSGVVSALGSCGGGIMPASVGATTGGQKFGVASFNVLGSSHTRRGERGFERGTRRIAGAARILVEQGVDVVGLQEFQRDQAAVFDRITGRAFDQWSPPSGTTENSVAWRTETFRFLEGQALTVPYFNGKPKDMSVVRLLFKPTQQPMWFISVHNPANVHGPAAQWRAEAAAKEFAKVRELAATGEPVFLLGDMNDRGFGQLAQKAGMVQSGPTRIDYVLATPGVYFTNHRTLQGPLVRKTSDHPVVVAEASIGTVS